jgi:enediyne biosynthesis protein E7
MILDETLRLYPSAFMLTRQSVGEQELGGYRVRAGAVAFISTWVMHRNPALWPDPLRFDPERFEPGKPAPDRFAYIPFGAGPRLCIGKQLALMEAQLIVAGIARRLRARPIEGERYPVEPLFTLHVAGGAPMRLEAR